MSTENSDSEAPSWVVENSDGGDYSLHMLENWSPAIEVSGGNRSSTMDDALRRLELRIKVEQERKFRSIYKTMFYLDVCLQAVCCLQDLCRVSVKIGMDYAYF